MYMGSKAWTFTKDTFQNKMRSTRSLINKCYLKCNCLNTSVLLKPFFFSPLLWSLLYNAKTSSSPSHLPPIPPSPPSLPRFLIILKHSEHPCRLFHWLVEFTFTSQDKHVHHFLMYSTHLLFSKHKPTTKKKKINFLDSFNVQKGLGKIIHIKEDQADVFKIAENKCFFFLFTIDQSPKNMIFDKDLSISWFEILFLWLSVSLSQGL